MARPTPRHRWMRAAVLSGSILSFVPVLWLVKDSTPAQAVDPTPSPAVTQPSRGDDGRFERRNQTPPQAVPNQTAPPQQPQSLPRAHSRSRAS